MESCSEENSGRGRGNDVLSATEGNSESRGRGSGGICDWEAGKGDLEIWDDRMQAREAQKGNESGASLSWLAQTSEHKPSDMYSSRPVSAASSLPSVFSPPGCTT